MTAFHEIQPKDINENTFSLIGDDWMLISAVDPKTGKYNTMTASWGGFGILFHKPVAYIFIRPQRYTKEFVDAAERLTLSFFGKEMRPALQLCGKKSGRECDKIQEAGLTPFVDEKIVGFSQAEKILVCRKLYASPLEPNAFIDTKIKDTTYPNHDYHTLYIVEIEKVLSK